MVLATAILLLAAAPTESPSSRLERIQKTYPELYDIAQAAHGVPPEFAASTLIRVATADKVKDVDWSVDLLTDAFQLAAAAQEAMPKQIRLASANPAVAAKAAGWGNRLDRLSLQVDAVRALLGRKPATARELFSEMPKPAPRAGTCSDPLIDKPDDYYALLAEIANLTYSPKERVKEEHLASAFGVIQSMSSPVEIAPVAKMILSLKLTPDQFNGMAASFGGALTRIAGDDRSFSSSLIEADPAVRNLASRSAQPDALIAAFRTYVERGFGGARCRDNYAWSSPNQVAQNLGIDFREIKPAKVEDVAGTDAVADPVADGLRREYMTLLSGANERSTKPSGGRASAWDERLSSFVAAVEEWRPAAAKDDSEINDARREMIGGLIWLTPSSEMRQKLIETYLGYLRTSAARPSSWAKWFDGFASLLRLSSMQAGGRDAVLDAFERSGDPVLMLYARVERVLPSK